MIISIKFRVIIVVCVAIILGSLYYISENSKNKKDLKQTTGVIVYLNKTFLNYPSTNKEKYRYLSIANYPLMFEMYADNQAFLIDKLKTGDVVTVYYNEVNENSNNGINSSLYFLEKDSKIYFKNTETYKTVCIVIIIITSFIGLISFILFKRGKLEL